MMKLTSLSIAVLVGAAAGCGTGGGGGGSDAGGTPATFTQVNNDVFTKSCNFSSCHDNKSKAGDLDLQTDPYHALVNTTAFQTTAAMEGLKRVVPGDTSKSFLYIKLTLSNAVDPKYGARMPNTGQTIDPGQLAEVASWITGGAQNN